MSFQSWSATRGRDAVRGAAVEELPLERRHQLVDLLADRATERLRLGRREAGELLRDLHVLLLVDADPVRVAVIGSQPLVDVRDRLAAVLARRVARDVLHRPRPVERDERDQVLELRRLHLAQRVAHPGRLELEDAGRVRAGEHLVRLPVVERDRRRCRGRRRSGSTALSITSRFRSPRKSIFSSPSASTFFIENCVTISASAPFCCSGTTSISGSRADHDARGVDRVGTGQPLERPGEVDDLPRDGVVVAPPSRARCPA